MKGEEDSKERKRQKEQDKLLRLLQQLIYQNYLISFKLKAVKNAIEQGSDGFFFAHNHMANKQIEKMLSTMARQMNVLLLNGIKREWK